MVMGGTKCPSMTSKCTQSAPACSSAATSSPSRLKSADNSDGATSTRGADPGMATTVRGQAVEAEETTSTGVDNGIRRQWADETSSHPPGSVPPQTVGMVMVTGASKS